MEMWHENKFLVKKFENTTFNSLLEAFTKKNQTMQGTWNKYDNKHPRSQRF